MLLKLPDMLKFNKTKLTYKSLRGFNLAVGILLLIQAVLVLVFANNQTSSRPISVSYLGVDKVASQASSSTVVAPAVHRLFDLNLAYPVAAFLLISAVYYLLMSSWRRKSYEQDIKQGINRARWAEYAISSSLMLATIAILSGVFDFASLLMLIAFGSITYLCGLISEVNFQLHTPAKWLNYVLGTIASLVPLLVLVIYFWSAHVFGNGLPTFVYFIYLSMFILFMTFPFNMYMYRAKKGSWGNYLHTERMYIVLNLVAKSILAWQIFAGTLR